MSIQLSESCRRSLQHTKSLRHSLEVFPLQKTCLAARRTVVEKKVHQNISFPNRYTIQSQKLLNASWKSLYQTRNYLTETSRLLYEDIELKKDVGQGIITEQPIHSQPISAEDSIYQFNNRIKQCINQVESNTPLHSIEISNLWNAYNSLLEYKTKVPLLKNDPLNSKSFEQLVLVLESRSRETRQSKCWGRIVQAYEDSQTLNIIPSVPMSLMAITAYGRVGRLKYATNVFQRLNPLLSKSEAQKEQLYERYMEACLNTGEFDKAFQILVEIRQSRIRTPVASRCVAQGVQVFLKKKNRRQAMAAAKLFSAAELGSDPSSLKSITRNLWTAYVDLMEEYGGLASKDNLLFEHFQVELFLEEFSKRTPTFGFPRPTVKNSSGLYQQANALFTANSLQTLMAFLTHIRPDFVPSIGAYNILLDIYAFEKDFSSVKTVLGSIQEHHLQATSQTTGLVLRAFSDSLSTAELQKLYNTLSKQGKLDTPIYNAFVHIYSNINTTGRAERVVLEMKKTGCNVTTDLHMTIVQSHVRNGRVDRALSWLETSEYSQMLRNQTKSMDSIDHLAALDPYAVVMEGLIGQYDIPRCLQLYKSLESGPFKSFLNKNRRIFKAVVTMACIDTDWKTCESYIINRTIDITPTTISRMINTLLNLRKDNKYAVSGTNIVRSLQSMETAASMFVSEDTISTVIQKLGERGQHEDAYRLYRWVRGEIGIGKGTRLIGSTKRSSKPAIYLAMMQAAIKNSDIRLSERASVDMMYRARMLMPGPKNPGGYAPKQIPSLNDFNMLLNAYASRLPTPDITRAKKTFQRMLKAGLVPDVVTYNTLIKAFISTDDLESANQIFYTMLDAGIKPDKWTVNTIVHGLVGRKEWTKIDTFVKGLKKDGIPADIDIVTFNLILQGFLCLDSNTLNHIRVLRSNHLWSKSRQLEKDLRSAYTLKSSVIWEIFETAIGVRHEEVEQEATRKITHSLSTDPIKTFDVSKDHPFYGTLCQQITQYHENTIEHASKDLTTNSQDQASKNAAIPSIFTKSKNARDLKPDIITYKLFMKAFENAGDPVSASYIHTWMTRRL
ncbi:hypothetical protein CLU79DRAFT_734406 [Phycomyces nitens]|nr:hypothetical protein CLU79DRAFT_734406 [Phycomyces nitens]